MFHGTKETGVVVKDKTTGSQMLWIPYDSSVTEEGLESYYQNCDYIPMDVDAKESIEHYGGFYVTLEETNQYETLKQVDTASYKKVYDQAKNMYSESENLNSHLLSKTELAQVLSYSNKLGINLAQTKSSNINQYQVKLTSSTGDPIALPKYTGVYSTTIKAYDNSYSDETIVMKINGQEIVKPKGFRVCVLSTSSTGINSNIDTDVVFKISDRNNAKINYIWVPVSEDGIRAAFDEMKKVYAQVDAEFWHEDAKDVESVAYRKAVESIATYGGFYIGEAELTYDTDGRTVINQAKGMKTESETGWAGEYWGEYLRGSKVGSYDKAMEIASDMHEDNDSVVSHLMYGSEWDATMLWLLEENEITSEQLIKDSSTVDGAKYQNTIADQLDENGSLLEKDLKGLNGIYGLAGNLVEVTQERATVDGQTMCVARGGSYLYTGNYYSMASRLVLAAEDIDNGDDIGFRNCLYISEDLEVEENEYSEYIEVTKNGQVSIKDEYKNSSKLPDEIEIPTSYDGITITAVAKNGFKDCEDLVEVKLPRTIKNIYANAFEGCTSLEEINLPSSLIEISTNAFKDCESLETITIPNNCEKINANAFNGCTDLKEVIFEGKDLETIKSKAFVDCDNLKSITFKSISENLEDEKLIEKNTFYNCDKLTVLNVPEDTENATINYIKKMIPTLRTVNKKDVETTANQVTNAKGSGLYIEDGEVVKVGMRDAVETEEGLYVIEEDSNYRLELINVDTDERVEFENSKGKEIEYESIGHITVINDKLYGIIYLSDSKYDGSVTSNGKTGYGTTGVIFQSEIDGSDFEVICDKVCKNMQYVERNGKDLIFANTASIENGKPYATNTIMVLDVTDSDDIEIGEKKLYEKTNDGMYIIDFAVAKNQLLVYLVENDRRELVNVRIYDRFFEAEDQNVITGTLVKELENKNYAPTLNVDYDENVFYVKEYQTSAKSMVYRLYNSTKYTKIMDDYQDISGIGIFDGEDGTEVWVYDNDEEEAKKIYSTEEGKLDWE